MGHDKKKSAAPPPGPGPLPYLENLVHPCVRLPAKVFLNDYTGLCMAYVKTKWRSKTFLIQGTPTIRRLKKKLSRQDWLTA